MSRPYICAVSANSPENFEIALIAGKWGVESKYRKKLSGIRPGDELVFVVGGAFRSVHRVLTEPYEEHTLLWPPKNGDLFPHRVNFGPAEVRREVAVARLAQSISFMRGKRWTGTLQGAHGVLNPRLTPNDLLLIKEALAFSAEESSESSARNLVETGKLLSLPPVQWVPDVFDQLVHLSKLQRDDRWPDPFVDAGERRNGLFAAVYSDPLKTPTVAVMPVERTPDDTVLTTL